MGTIDIVIVNWNSGKLLKNCVESIMGVEGSSVCKVVIVDNNSDDGSTLFLGKITEVELIRASENLGFGKACNLGAAKCDSKFILFLNPDAMLFHNTLSSVLKFMEEKGNSQIGICGVPLRDENGVISRSCSRFPSVKGMLAHACGLSRVVPSLGDPMREWDHGNSRVVDQVIGAFFFVRRHIFDELNGFDERFFVYFEEVDFSYRAKAVGWTSFFLSESLAYHLGGGVSRQVKSKRLFFSLRSRIQYAFKNFSQIEVVFTVLITFILEPIFRTALCLAKLSLTSLKETLGAYFMLYMWPINWLLRRSK